MFEATRLSPAARALLQADDLVAQGWLRASGAPLDVVDPATGAVVGTVPTRPDAPWPGAGDSGIGVDRGMDGFREFLHVRHVQFPLGAVR